VPHCQAVLGVAGTFLCTEIGINLVMFSLSSLLFTDCITGVAGVIAMHLETLDAVHQESKRLPPVPKVCSFTLLPQCSYVLLGHHCVMWLTEVVLS